MFWLTLGAIIKLIGMVFVFAHVEWRRQLAREWKRLPCARVVRR